jgi:hypothetical protein
VCSGRERKKAADGGKPLFASLAHLQAILPEWCPRSPPY